MDNPWMALAAFNRSWAERFPQLSAEEIEQYMKQRNAIFEQCEQYTVMEEELAALRPVLAELMEQDAILLEALEKQRDKAAEALKNLAAKRKQQAFYMGGTKESESLFFDRKR